jgi:transposase
MLRDGQIVNIGSRSKVYIQREDGTVEGQTEAAFMDEFLTQELAPYADLKVRKHTRTIYQGVTRKYLGKKIRDKEMPTFCAFRTKNLVWNDSFFKFVDGDINGKIEYKSITGEKIQLGYRKTSKTGRIEKNALKYLSLMNPNKAFGATMVINKEFTTCTIVATVDVPVTFGYEPKRFVGLDLNVSPKHDNWIYFSEPVLGCKKIPKSLYKDILKTEEEITALNDLIRVDKCVQKRTINSKRRGKLRRKLQKKHALHKKQIKNAKFPGSDKTIIDVLCSWAEQNQIALGIDSVKCGQTTGTFGQDKFPQLLIARSEELKIPYISSPTPYTSRRCIDCGHIEAEYYANGQVKPNAARDTETNIFTCKKCDSPHDADFVGAVNVADYASFLWAIDQCQGDEMRDKWPLVKKSFLFKDHKFPKKEKKT